VSAAKVDRIKNPKYSNGRGNPNYRMSAADVRSLLKQARETRRISHPYAKYSAQGVLYCTACAVKVASEALWDTHVALGTHKDRVRDLIRESQWKAKRGIAATMMEEEEANEEMVGRKKVRREEEKSVAAVEAVPAVVEDGEKEALPADFFDPGMKPVKSGVDEDEWKKFQAEISETIRNQEDEDKEDVEELQRGMVEEFDELNTLEDRVERLKRKRAEFEKTAKHVEPAVNNEDEEEAEEEEGWW
jgi:zinc finger protein 830